MPTANINANNVIRLTVNLNGADSVLDFSLQRHHYGFLEGADSAPVNSILYYSVRPADLVPEAIALGGLIEAAAVRFADFRVASGRVYRVDHSGGNVARPPNHFFVISGPQVWGGLTREDWLAAKAIRVLQLAVEGDPKAQNGKLRDRYDTLRRDPTLTNFAKTQFPVYSAVEAARTSLRDYNKLEDLKRVTGQEQLIKVVGQILKDDKQK